jgi:hypothetical protein
LADGVEKWVHAEECHVEAVAVERVLERVEGMVEFVDAKIIGAYFVSGTGAGWNCEQSAGPHAPIGPPSVLPIHAKKSGGVEPWLLVQHYQIVLYGFIVLALLLVNKTYSVFDGAGMVFHLGRAL